MWRLDGDTATLDSSGVRLQINLATDEHCADLRDAAGKELASLWGLRSLRESPLASAHIRDDDLVASYAPTKEFPFFTQLDWTLRSIDTQPKRLFALSLLISMRTDLLDTHPEMNIISLAAPRHPLSMASVAGGRMFWGELSESATLIDFAAEEDFAEQKVITAKANIDGVQRTLFAPFLEKGVIRRARLFAAIAPAGITEQQAAAICEEFSTAELPLAT